ncbi:MAG: glycosyltransferase family 39 protein [Candidatus Omnitrophota bacterium]
MNKERKDFLTAVLLGGILLVGLGLRIYSLGRYSLWYDEALSALQAGQLAKVNFAYGTPPAYIFFLSLWIKLTVSEFGLRLPSVIFGSASIVMMFLLGKVFFSTRAGLLGAFLLALSPFHIYYSQAARMYTAVAFFTLSSCYLYVRALENGKLAYWTGYVLLTLLNIFTHYIGFLFWIVQLVYYPIGRKIAGKETMRIWLLGNIAIAIIAIGWFGVIFNTIGGIEGMGSPYLLGKVLTPTWRSLLITFKNFSSGYNASGADGVLTVALFSALFLIGVVKNRRNNGTLLCMLSMIGPVIAVFLLSYVRPVYIDRYFIGSSAFFLLVAAAGLAALPKKAITVAALSVVLLAAPALACYYGNILPYGSEYHIWEVKKKDHRAVASYLCGRYEKGDRLYHACRNTVFPFEYYCRRLNNKLLVPGVNDVCLGFERDGDRPRLLETDINLRCAEIRNKNSDLLGENGRFWFIYSSWDMDNVGKDEPEIQFTLDRINRNYRSLEKKKIDGIIIYLYCAPRTEKI